MDPSTVLPVAAWQNFYVIVGSSAGALTGLQFVVITLLAQSRVPGSMREIRAFGTPTVIHFCTALLVAALMTAPWRALVNFGVCLAVCGAAGVAYSASTIWHARKAEYNPDLEDWIWYTALPLIAHAALLAAAVLLWWNVEWSLVTVAADSLLFLLLGVHNAWDSVTYIVIRHTKEPAAARRSEHES
jgi:hypothetical protein